MKETVLIIGAGVGGLATAVRLLSKGYDVRIYEKEARVGGKINLREADRFKFDLTASILMTPNAYQEVFEWCDKKYEDYLEFIKIEPSYRVYYSDGSSYDFSTDLTKLIPLLESFSKEDSLGYLKYLAESYKKYLVASKEFLSKSFRNASSFININTLTEALKIKPFSTPCSFISKYLKNDQLKQYLCFQAQYIGSSPYNTSSIYTILPTISQLYGLWHLKGGMYSYIKALQKLVIELGGTIETKVNVEEILIENETAIGLKTNKEIARGDLVVCNADFPYASKELIKDKKAKGAYTAKKLASLKYSCSTFIIYLGLKKKYENLAVHNLYLNDAFKKNIELPFKGSLPDKPSLYLYCPSRVDGTMAPKGRELLSIIVRVPNLQFNTIAWNEKTIKELRAKIIATVSEINGLEDIEDNIIHESYFTPKDLQNSFNSYYGTAFGLSHTLTQTNYFRPHVKSENTKNLYFVGSSVHPGTGVSMVLLSSKLAVEEIIKDR